MSRPALPSMKQISLWAATTPWSPPDLPSALPSGLPSEPAGLDELDWVVDEEVSGTLIYPGKTVKVSRVARCADYSGDKMTSQRGKPFATRHLPLVVRETRGACTHDRVPRAASGEWQMAIRSFEPAAPLPAVPRQRVLDDRERHLRRLNLVHLHDLALELRVVLEEPPQHDQPVARHVGGFAVAVELRVFRRHSNHLVVLLPLVDHRH